MTAKLEELKKLKVPELRSRLKELGLDSKGLKAELVGRLWSAVDGGLESKLKSDTSKPHSTSSAEEEAVSPPLSARREYSDIATQTDIELSVAAVSPDTRLLTREEAQHKRKGDEHNAADDGKTLRAERGKGRAFYEFKEEIKYKRAKLPPVPATEEILKEDQNKVKIDLYNSHLHFEVEPDGTSGHPRFWERCPLLWSGCRLTHGAQQNRVGFEVRLERLFMSQPQGQKDVPLDTFGLRVGWSGASTSLMLGNDVLSFAYDGRGKKVSQGKEDDYGQPLSVGDIIGCFASFSSDGAAELSFHKNGFFMGIAFSLEASVLQGQPLFPHVVCRSCSVRFLLDPLSPAWYPSPSGFTPLIALPDSQKICSVSAPQSKSQCEMILMVGFPGAGKTHWAKNHINQHPEQHYKLLNTDELLACMTMNIERDVELQQASQCLTELIKLAAERPGNYILDQCNILFSARQYKLQLFKDFRCTVKVIFPSKEEWHKRLSKHQMREGQQIPQAAFLKLQVSCTLPEQESLIDELQYVELSQQQAQTVLQEYKDEARRLLPPLPKHDKKLPRYNKKKSYLHCPPLSYKTQCTDQNGWTNLHAWSQPQQFWPTTYLQEY